MTTKGNGKRLTRREIERIDAAINGGMTVQDMIADGTIPSAKMDDTVERYNLKQPGD
ncbi:MAG TPA: hypothetical protein VGK23_06255 [Methanomassiliicoccales archaeon]